jgi:hypothetical protein
MGPQGLASMQFSVSALATYQLVFFMKKMEQQNNLTSKDLNLKKNHYGRNAILLFLLVGIMSQMQINNFIIGIVSILGIMFFVLWIKEKIQQKK